MMVTSPLSSRSEPPAVPRRARPPQLECPAAGELCGHPAPADGEPDPSSTPAGDPQLALYPTRWRRALCAPRVDAIGWRTVYGHRVNGLHGPHDNLQVTAWVCYGVFGASFLALTMPLLPTRYGWPASGVFFILYCASIASCFSATASNAADPGVLHKLVGDASYVRTPAGKQKCLRGCCALVSINAYHCRKCNKCVAGFDHHCRWVNNCVGAANYRHFVTFIVSTLLVIFYQLGLSGAALWHAWTQETEADERTQRLYRGSVKVSTLRIALCASVALELAAATLLAHLGAFHAWIAYRRQTTYEWVLARREVRQRSQRRALLLGWWDYIDEHGVERSFQITTSPAYAGSLALVARLPQEPDGGAAEAEEIRAELVYRGLPAPRDFPPDSYWSARLAGGGALWLRLTSDESRPTSWAAELPRLEVLRRPDAARGDVSRYSALPRHPPRRGLWHAPLSDSPPGCPAACGGAGRCGPPCCAICGHSQRAAGDVQCGEDPEEGCCGRLRGRDAIEHVAMRGDDADSERAHRLARAAGNSPPIANDSGSPGDLESSACRSGWAMGLQYSPAGGMPLRDRVPAAAPPPRTPADTPVFRPPAGGLRRGCSGGSGPAPAPPQVEVTSPASEGYPPAAPGPAPSPAPHPQDAPAPLTHVPDCSECEAD
eukprot:TRINITY_DN27651_c0_g1_i1.p1 TRINITY_DN27651_c0_g1~~TRINITY_DN27651_c0_g1_i1.p1  ORF type:complete len:660 (+),score=136.19 TRINITY_DN27651_c0_g1_i1:177-2156(+)